LSKLYVELSQQQQDNPIPTPPNPHTSPKHKDIYCNRYIRKGRGCSNRSIGPILEEIEYSKILAPPQAVPNFNTTNKNVVRAPGVIVKQQQQQQQQSCLERQLERRLLVVAEITPTHQTKMLASCTKVKG
jgi:hypothetical protein